MESFATWFKTKRLAAKFLTQPDLFIATGVSVRTISKIESGEYVSLNRTNTNALADKLGVPKDEFRQRMQEAVGAMKKPAKKSSDAPNIPAGISAPASIAPVPTFTYNTSASAWVEVPIVEFSTYDKDERAIIEAGRFKLRIDGACMFPDFQSGSLVEFEIIRPDLMHGLELNHNYAIVRSDGLTTFKKLVGKDDDSITLAAINQDDYPGTITVAWQDVVRVARVVGVVGPPPPPTPIQIQKAYVAEVRDGGGFIHPQQPTKAKKKNNPRKAGHAAGRAR